MVLVVFFLFLLVPDGLRVYGLDLLFVNSIYIASHFFVNLVQDEFGFFVDVGSEVLMVNFQLVWIGKDEFFKRKGVVKLVTIMDPTLGNNWYLFVRQLLQFCLLFPVVFSFRELAGGWCHRGGLLRNGYYLRFFGLFHEVISSDD